MIAVHQDIQETGALAPVSFLQQPTTTYNRAAQDDSNTRRTMDLSEAAKTVHRRDIIKILGVTYAHSGDWRSPIVEVVGKRIIDIDPLSDRQMFARERDAVEHVIRLAQAEAHARLPVLRQAMEDRGLKLRLWLARNWDRVRKGSIGILATHAIKQESIREYELILGNRFEPRVTRLPDQLRVPAVLVLDTPVWVVDTSGFPERPATLIQDRISYMEFEDGDPSGRFDFRVRYRLAATRGLFLYEHVGTTVDMLDSPGLKSKAFLREEAAHLELEIFHERVHAVLASSAGAIPMLPAPAAAPSLPTPTEPVMEPEAFIETKTKAAERDEEDEAMKLANVRRAVLGLLNWRRKAAPTPLEVAPQVVEGPISKLRTFASSGLTIRRPPEGGNDLATKALERVGLEQDATSTPAPKA